MKLIAKRPVRKMRPAVVPVPARTMTTRSMSRDLKNVSRNLKNVMGPARGKSLVDVEREKMLAKDKRFYREPAMTIEKQDKRRPVFTK